MKELNGLIIARMNNMTESGAIQQLIDKQLEDSVKEILKDSLRSYSDFGKAIKEKLSESLAGAVEKVTFPEYNKFISDAVVECVSSHMGAEVVAGIQENLKEILQPVPKQIGGTEFLERLGRFFEFESNCVESDDGLYISPKWNMNDDETAIYMSVDGEFKVTFYDFKKDGSWYIGYIESGSGRHITADLGGATHAMGVIGFLYKLYCTGTTFAGIDACCNDEEVIPVH